jgi:predicted nucleic acid-binding protein
VDDEIVVAGAGLPGADEVLRADWLRVQRNTSAPSASLEAACAGLGVGERSAILLASELGADLLLVDDARARRAAATIGIHVAGALALLERGARLGRISDLRAVYLALLAQGIRYDRNLLNTSLRSVGLPEV